MGTNITFTEQAFEEYLSWQRQDRKTLKRINALLKDICRSPFEGIGKPEPLKENLSGYWSWRIDDTNRLVYRMVDGQVEVYQCKGHYDDWVSEAVLPAASLFLLSRFRSKLKLHFQKRNFCVLEQAGLEVEHGKKIRVFAPPQTSIFVAE